MVVISHVLAVLCIIEPVRTWCAPRQVRVKKNYTADTAVDAIYDKYGKDRRVNAILLDMRKDRKAKALPSTAFRA